MSTSLLVSTGAASCYPAPVVFADDKFLKIYGCILKKHAKRLHLHVCVDSLTFTCSSKTVHQHTELARWLSFWLERHLTSAPMLLSADTMNSSGGVVLVEAPFGGGTNSQLVRLSSKER